MPVLGPSFLGPPGLGPGFLGPGFLGPSFLGPPGLGPGFLGPSFLGPPVLSPSFLGSPVLGPSFLGPSILDPSFLGSLGLGPSFLGSPGLGPGFLGSPGLGPGFLGPPCLGLTEPEATDPDPAIGFGCFAASTGSDLTARVTTTAASSNPDNHCSDPPTARSETSVEPDPATGRFNPGIRATAYTASSATATGKSTTVAARAPATTARSSTRCYASLTIDVCRPELADLAISRPKHPALSIAHPDLVAFIFARYVVIGARALASISHAVHAPTAHHERAFDSTP